MTAQFRTDTEALLAHAGWMRALAFSLLGDSSAADDVVQDATVAALVHPPAGDVGLEPWLSRVVRNFAFRRRRAETRRAEREALAMPPLREPTPAETVERLDLQRALVEIVLTIDEPLRTTIVLRYFESKSSAEIARLQHIPAGTVRWRIKRGLEELRERLDARSGSRENWVALIAPFAARSAVPTTGSGAALTTSNLLTGMLAMKSAQLSAAALLVLVVGGIAWWGLNGSRERLEVGSAVAATPTASAGETAFQQESEQPEQLETARASVGTAQASTETAEVPAVSQAERIASVDARFIDEHGAPWSGVRLAARGVHWIPSWKPGEAELSDTDGRVTLEILLPEQRALGTTHAELKIDLAASRNGCGTVVRSATLRVGETAHLGDVVLLPGVRIFGRTVDENGKGVARAVVGVAPAELSGDEGRMRRHGLEAFSEIPGTKSLADGAFVLEGVSPGTLRIWAHGTDQRFSWSAPIEVSRDRDVHVLDLVLTPLLDTDRIAGSVVAPYWEPLKSVDLTFNERSRGSGVGTSIPVDADGNFSLLVEHDDSIYEFTARDGSDRFTPTTVAGILPGSLGVLISLQPKEFIKIHVHNAEGEPILGARFDVQFGGSFSQELSSSTAPGDYSIARPGGAFLIQVSASGYRSMRLGSNRALLDPATLPMLLDAVLQRAPRIHGRVLADGAAFAGARVRIAMDSPDLTLTAAGYRARYFLSNMPPNSGWGSGTVSDAEGRFEIDCDHDKGFWLIATAQGWATGEVGPLDARELGADNPIDVELTKGGAIEGRVLLPEGRDGEGAIIAFNHGDSKPRTLRAGPQGFFRVEGLSPGKWQVLPAESEINPARMTYSGIWTQVEPIEWSCEVRAGETTRFDVDRTKP